MKGWWIGQVGMLWLGLAVTIAAESQPEVRLEAGHRHGIYAALVEPGSPADGHGPVLWAHFTYARFTDAFAGPEWGLQTPPSTLEIVVLSDADRMQRYARQFDGLARVPWIGYYSVATHRVVLRDPGGATNSAQRALAEGSVAVAGPLVAATDQVTADAPQQAEPGTRPAYDNRYAFITHEAAHQLAFTLGLQRPGVAYPLWVSEGLACAFEWQGPAAGFGPGQANPQRQEALTAVVKADELIPLAELVALTAIRFGARDNAEAFYAQAWGLFSYLYQHHPRELASYLAALRQSELNVSDSAQARRLFEASFGDLSQVERAWHRQLRAQATSSPVEPGVTMASGAESTK